MDEAEPEEGRAELRTGHVATGAAAAREAGRVGATSPRRGSQVVRPGRQESRLGTRGCCTALPARPSRGDARPRLGLARFAGRGYKGSPMERFSSFLKRRYGHACAFAVPVVLACVLLGVLGNVLEAHGVPREAVDGVLVVSMCLLVGAVGFVMFTRRTMPGLLGRWQRLWRTMGSWRERRAERAGEGAAADAARARTAVEESPGPPPGA